ncbi:hypothetical protein [Streptomyces decoyicus]|uniref:hypothetical protein n=1 Tax=Streptomyces decoyicus TaxID=249567 RepID=UPI003652F593
MSATIAPPTPPSATTLLAALSAADVRAFYDEGEDVVFAHHDTVKEDQALNHVHVMLVWNTQAPDHPGVDRAYVSATIWEPNGAPDFHQLGTVYTTTVRRPLAEEADLAARAVADWLAHRRAEGIILNALAEYGLLPARGALLDAEHFDLVCALTGDGVPPLTGVLISPDRIDIPMPFGHGYWGRLSIADRACSTRHVPSIHTGWTMFLHDERGEPVGDPVYISGDGGLVDCAEDSAALAAAVADWLTSPVSRHCDCYGNERPGRPHDRECNRYRRPERAA